MSKALNYLKGKGHLKVKVKGEPITFVIRHKEELGFDWYKVEDCAQAHRMKRWQQRADGEMENWLDNLIATYEVKT